MTKKPSQRTKDQKQSKNQKAMRVTVLFGYGLFIVVMLAFFVGYSGLFKALVHPDVNHVNVAIILLTWLVATAVPPLLGYFVGDKATRRKSKLIHRYNGVLFGVLGVWLGYALSMILTVLTYSSEQFIVYTSQTMYYTLQFLPIIITIALLVILGIYYGRKTSHQKPLVEYHPYQVALAATIGALFAFVLVMGVLGSLKGGDLTMSLIITGLAPVAILFAFGATGYWLLGKKSGTPSVRATKSFIAVSFGYIAIMTVGEATISIPVFESGVPLYIPLGLAAIVWAGYLYCVRRALR